MPSVPLSMLMKKSKCNSAWHSSLQCCLTALMCRKLADSGCQYGVFVRVFVRLFCNEILLVLWITRSLDNFWVSPVSMTSDPQNLSGMKCGPVVASHTKHGMLVK